MGSIASVPIILTNRMPKVTVSSKDYLPILISNPEATTAAFRAPDLFFDQGSVIVETAANTFDRIIGWTSDGQAVYGAKVTNPKLLRRYLIRNEL